MLINLNNDLSVGDEFQVILEFKEAGEIIINVPVHEP
ncbi:MAG: copper chaperone PCu(A)C [Aliifodinibius sp.]|nr:copper chaperone PCu(A)C [Fodinibius sp.]